MSQITANFNPNSSQKIGITFNNTITPLKLTPSARSTVESWGYDASQINSLDIPLGASSYSHGVFLFDFDGFSKLSSASSQAFTLNMNAADQNVLVSHYTGQYYLHRVENLHEASEGFGLYLAHFVDSRRYAASKLWMPTSASGYGQTAHQNRANYIGGSSASLQSLLTAAMGQWGSGTVVNAIDSSYNALDWGLTKNITTEPVATIIDRICKLTGLVISGDQNAYSYASSTLGKVLDSEPNTGSGSYANQIVAGGHTWNPNNGIGQMVPANVTVLMPYAGLGGFGDATPQRTTDYGYYSVNIAGSIQPSNSNYTEVLYDNFWVQGVPGNVPSSAQSAAQSRAQLVADAYYRRFKAPLGRWRLKGWTYNPKWLVNARLFLGEHGEPLTDIWIQACDITSMEPGRRQKVSPDGGIQAAQSGDGELRLAATGQSFWAKITGSSFTSGSGTTYSWQEVQPTATGNTASSWSAVPNGRTGSSNAINTAETGGSSGSVQTGAVVRMGGPYYFSNNSANTWTFYAPTASFPVLVQQNGGAAGTSTTTISATYNVYATSDTGMTTPLNGSSPLSPLMNRTLISPANVTIAVAAAGSIGLACYSGSTLNLLWVQETPTWGC